VNFQAFQLLTLRQNLRGKQKQKKCRGGTEAKLQVMLPREGRGGDELAGEGSTGTRQLTEFALHMLTKLMTGAVPRLHLGPTS